MSDKGGNGCVMAKKTCTGEVQVSIEFWEENGVL